ncbi:hypothetical protein MPTK1_6g05520 [Marchantia polymorpha subsp. ruderalis]|nr:hypothetical protein MARPO_0097s0090 [Marchantia polymorpha]BBN13676.1 hypothetical protein Mp_6g05520 [Marchantia polymorpha subsp. ruderalis]|eukprot:PTQ32635.1 hypothetical protein MARPO_0097s0090 [Marchantia polymorpha]
MAVNPPLFGNGTPIPFVDEMFVLTRDSVEFNVDHPYSPGSKFSAKGSLLISNFRVVFVATKPVGNIAAYDLPLLYIHDEKFNQPILFCNNLSGKVHPVVPDGEHPSLYKVSSFKILFKEGGVGTFVPLFFGLLRSVRAANVESVNVSAPPANPLPSEQAPVEDMIRHAYIDPNDPTRVYLQQPFDTQPSLRRRTYKAYAPEEGQL